jgi:hypothetical protein
MFEHLKKVNQNYVDHFNDGINFSFMSLKATFYFLIHSLWPDFYECDGSKTIKELHNILEEKKRKRNI